MQPFRLTFLSSVILLAALNAPLLAQDQFPAIQGETTQGTVVRLPPSDPAGYTIIALAYGKKAQPLLEEWYGPAYARFIGKQGLFASTYQVDLFLVPMFVGLNRSALKGAMNKLRKEADPDIARRVVFFKGDAKPVIQTLGLTDKNIPYFFLLDGKGRIIKRVSGAFSLEKLDALEAPMLN